MSQEFLTIKEIAELEQKSLKTIRRAIASNELLAEKKGGNFYSVNKERNIIGEKQRTIKLIKYQIELNISIKILNIKTLNL